jgi:hypothetical protein
MSILPTLASDGVEIVAIHFVESTIIVNPFLI